MVLAVKMVVLDAAAMEMAVAEVVEVVMVMERAGVVEMER